MHTPYISLPVSRGPDSSLGSPGSQVKNAVGIRYFNLPECELMHMGSAAVFKGPLPERLVYFHHCTDRETEAQNGTGCEGHLPEELFTWVKQVSLFPGGVNIWRIFHHSTPHGWFLGPP